MQRHNKAIKFAPYGRRTLASSRRLWRRYAREAMVQFCETERLLLRRLSLGDVGVFQDSCHCFHARPLAA
jgi:hypothetical protein